MRPARTRFVERSNGVGVLGRPGLASGWDSPCSNCVRAPLARTIGRLARLGNSKCKRRTKGVAHVLKVRNVGAGASLVQQLSDQGCDVLLVGEAFLAILRVIVHELLTKLALFVVNADYRHRGGAEQFEELFVRRG